MISWTKFSTIFHFMNKCRLFFDTHVPSLQLAFMKTCLATAPSTLISCRGKEIVLYEGEGRGSEHGKSTRCIEVLMWGHRNQGFWNAIPSPPPPRAPPPPLINRASCQDDPRWYLVAGFLRRRRTDAAMRNPVRDVQRSNADCLHSDHLRLFHS